MIFYFSGTGNSKYLAQKAAENITGEVVSITQAMRENNFDFTVKRGEKVGFVTPVYFYGIPKCVLEFLDKAEINLGGENYVFSALTCGGTTANAGKMLEKALKKKGIAVDAHFAVAMPDNYIPMYEIQSEAQARDKLKKADSIIERITEDIASGKRGDFDACKGTVFMTKALYPLYRPMRKTKRFYVTDNCVSCGKCESGCVDRAIEMQNGKPVWVKGECTRCLRCIHACPQRAIQLGKKTENRNRYMNPFVQ